jgi:hypothetical protein
MAILRIYVYGMHISKTPFHLIIVVSGHAGVYMYLHLSATQQSHLG